MHRWSDPECFRVLDLAKTNDPIGGERRLGDGTVVSRGIAQRHVSASEAFVDATDIMSMVVALGQGLVLFVGTQPQSRRDPHRKIRRDKSGATGSSFRSFVRSFVRSLDDS
eukprot:scaffold674_cov130-Amphora_coffeaeformis.AAC.12